jgi:hypothetical protein
VPDGFEPVLRGHDRRLPSLWLLGKFSATIPEAQNIFGFGSNLPIAVAGQQCFGAQSRGVDDDSRRFCSLVSGLALFHTPCAVERLSLRQVVHLPRCSQDFFVLCLVEV